MAIRFKKNTNPLLDDDIWSKLKNDDAFNTDNLNQRDVEIDNFFDVLDDSRKVGFVFFTLDDERNIEISLGKTEDDCKGFLQKVLSELDTIKSLLPHEWFDVNDSNHCQYWLGIIKGTNPALEYIKQVNLECGFEEYDHNSFDIPICKKRFYFRKNIAQ